MSVSGMTDIIEAQGRAVKNRYGAGCRTRARCRGAGFRWFDVRSSEIQLFELDAERLGNPAQCALARTRLG